MRDIPFTHQLDTTDQQFLDHLKLPPPAGKQLDRAKRESDIAAARVIVAEHFRTRRSPTWSFYSHGSPWHQT